jgi:site-specific DNA-methyltransferase (adenine-specific)
MSRVLRAFDSPPRRELLHGDASEVLRDLPTGSIDTVVTSQPYLLLRNYQVRGQIGAEQHVDDWVSALREAARECARVLVPTGTLWLNLGDTYSIHSRQGAPRKSLLLGPERVAQALIEDGWTLRNKIVWAKPSTTPTSVRDRLSTKHEVIYLFARQPSYFFDLDAIRVPHTSKPRKPRPTIPLIDKRPDWLGPNSDDDRGLAALHAAGITGHPLGKNPGDVWTIGVSRYRGAHFATYPIQLVDRILRAGCPERRCIACRRPWVHPLKRSGPNAERMPLVPTCSCRADSEPGLVLDPFIGSGTTAVTAEALGRDWLGIDLNPDYLSLAEARIKAARPTSATKRKEVA